MNLLPIPRVPRQRGLGSTVMRAYNPSGCPEVMAGTRAWLPEPSAPTTTLRWSA